MNLELAKLISKHRGYGFNKLDYCEVCGNQIDTNNGISAPLSFVCGSTAHFHPQVHYHRYLCSKCYETAKPLIKAVNHTYDKLADLCWDTCALIACDWCREGRNSIPWPHEIKDGNTLETWLEAHEANCSCKAWDVYGMALKECIAEFEAVYYGLISKAGLYYNISNMAREEHYNIWYMYSECDTLFLWFCKICREYKFDENEFEPKEGESIYNQRVKQIQEHINKHTELVS